MRQALAGMRWSKQYSHDDVDRWWGGDAVAAPPQRPQGRNAAWSHITYADVRSMPATWEYPWFASWDLAIHTLPLALVDLEFAKAQRLQLVRARYLHPDGQLPAYEWNCSDVNPPRHAWAAWHVCLLELAPRGPGDPVFLTRVFHKLLLNFTWWVNRKDLQGHHVFAGGFWGPDTIGVCDRSAPLPTGGLREQSDGTSGMAFYRLTLAQIALELAQADPTAVDLVGKDVQHLFSIAAAMEIWDRPMTGSGTRRTAASAMCCA
jgi:hypothetical protein